VARLRHLRWLSLHGLRKLSSLRGIEELDQLETLAVSACRGISGIQEVQGLARLKKLQVDNCGDVASLSPLEGLKSLELITFCDSTNIVDGNLSYLEKYDNLERLGFSNRRHYTHKLKEFRATHLHS
jgi:hypothetical protein